MNLRLWILLAVFLGSLSVCITAQAAPILIVNADGILTGARDVTVHRAYPPRADELWDVDFVDGTCAQVFGTCMTGKFPFHQFDIESALQALRSVFVDSPGGLFDSFPNRTLGCTGENVTICGIVIPDDVFFDGYILEAGVFVNDLGICSNVLPTCPGSVPVNLHTLLTEDLADEPNLVWARWTPSAVPEPLTLTLLGFGIAGIGAVRKK